MDATWKCVKSILLSKFIYFVAFLEFMNFILRWNGLKKKSPDTYKLKAFDRKDKVSNL